MHVDYVKVFMSSPVNNDEHSNLAKGDETFLRKYKYEIIVTKTDKGNKTVIMYRDTYKHGMETLLAEKNIQNIENGHHTKVTTKKLMDLHKQNYIIMDLHKQNYIIAEKSSN